MKINKYIDKNINRIDGKTVIVTGANSGIGFLLCKNLVMLGGNVVMAGRNQQRLIKARDDILSEFPDSQIEIMQFDLDDFKILDNFIAEIEDKYQHLDGLILNAGILTADKDEVTKQGYPKVVGDNFLSIVYLMNNLKPYLKNKKTSLKVIFQGSLMSRKVKYQNNDILSSNSKGLKSYGISKTGIENLFIHLVKENNNENIKYLLAEPGACKTNIYHNLPKWIIPAADAFMSIAFHSALKGSLSALYLMCNDTLNGDIYVPRGIGHYSGYPKKIKLSKKVLKNHQVLIDGYKLLDDKLTD